MFLSENESGGEAEGAFSSDDFIGRESAIIHEGDEHASCVCSFSLYFLSLKMGQIWRHAR